MASDAALIVVAIVAVAAVGIAVFLLTQPPVPAAQTTVVVRERAWRPWGPYYQHLPRHRMLY